MEHSSSVLALAGALLLAGGGDSRLKSVTSGSFAERSPAAVWSRALHATEQTQVSAAAPARGAASKPEAAPDSGRFSLLTYNVAGLPQLVSRSDPEVNVALISPLLNHYDVALVQEDFSYHSRLVARARHGYRSEPMTHSLALMADGLNWFSRFPLGWIHRVRWAQCHGYLGAASDCLADKGFSFGELSLAPGIVIDVYNLHAEAGGSKSTSSGGGQTGGSSTPKALRCPIIRRSASSWAGRSAWTRSWSRNAERPASPLPDRHPRRHRSALPAARVVPPPTLARDRRTTTAKSPRAGEMRDTLRV